MTTAGSVALASTWMQTFLVRPHPSLGRDGLVCPFMPAALHRDLVDVHEQPCDYLSHPDRLEHDMLEHQRRFLARSASASAADRGHLASVVVFACHAGCDRDHGAQVTAMQSQLKGRFIDAAMMIGEFFPGCPTQGLHSEEFNPLSSPVTMLAMRHMVPSDLPFLTAPGTDTDTDTQRAYLDTYGRTFADILDGDETTALALARSNAATPVASA